LEYRDAVFACQGIFPEELEAIIKHEKLHHDETYKLVRNAFRSGGVATTGTELAGVLPPVSCFSPGGER